MAQIHLEVVTPSGPVVSEDVDIVTAPGSRGEFGVLANHAPFLTTIKPGTLTYKKDRDTQHLMVSGGFVEISNNRATFLVESSEFGTAIDQEMSAIDANMNSVQNEFNFDYSQDFDTPALDASSQLGRLLMFGGQ